MVIGNGFLAKAFNEFIDDVSIIIFSSGVSNSSETDNSEFLREQNLLSATIESYPEKRIVYFSTTSIFDPSQYESLYMRHKAAMEDLLTSRHTNHLILRLPNVVGFSKNLNTLTNYIYYHIKSDQVFSLYKNAYRYLIDIDDVVKLSKYIIRSESGIKLFNITHSEPISSFDLIKCFENVLEKKGNYIIREKGAFYKVPYDIKELPLEKIGITFSENYYAELIQKYYSGNYETL